MKYIKLSKFIIHFKNNKSTVEFIVYPIVEYVGTNDFAYLNKNDNNEHIDVFDEDKCSVKFYGFYSDRGVIESKLYFHDEEYQGEDLSTMSDIYNRHIIPWCEKYLKK